MPYQGVVIDLHLGVQGEKQILIVDNQRIDLGQEAITLYKHLVEALNDAIHLIKVFRVNSRTIKDILDHVRLNALKRLNESTDNFGGVRIRNFIDFHSPRWQRKS